MAKKTTTHKPPKLPPAIIIAAITGFESQKTRIDAEIATLRAMLDGGTKPTLQETPTRKRKKFSVAGRRRMKEAQRLRWAKIRGESEPPEPATPVPSKPKRKLSKAGRAAIVAALKKRWAAKKAAKAEQEKAAAKKPAKKTTAKKASVKKAAKPVKKGVTKKTAPAVVTEAVG